MIETIRETLRIFSAHGGRVLGAATAFYGMLAVAPMLLMAVVVTGLLIGERDARGAVIGDISLWVGAEGGQILGAALDDLAQSRSCPLAGTIGVALLLWAGMRLFWQLRYSLHHIWDVREVPLARFGQRALHQARMRLSALVMVVIVVAVVTAMVIVKTVLASAESFLESPLPARWHVLDLAGSFVVLTILFAAVFKVLPAVRLSWRDIAVGALATGLLFSIGAALVSAYLGFAGAHSIYGAAGSIVALLIWVNYSAQAFFLGAAFTRVYAERHGRGLVLLDGAVRLMAAPKADDSAQAAVDVGKRGEPSG